MPLKVGIYSPYLQTFGGGERFLLSIAQTLSLNHDVDLYATDDVKEKSKLIFGIDLKRVHFLLNTIFQTQNVFNKYVKLCQYDLFFYMTDGSLFFSGAKNNFLIIQSPVHTPKATFVNKLKLLNWKIICYSQFIKNIITEKSRSTVYVLPPCIPTAQFRKDSYNKENLILTVGRFFPFPHNKKQEVLVKVFKKYYLKYLKGWKLVVAGGLTEEEGKEVLKKLKNEAQDYPIEILANIPYERLITLYQRAKLYWHAAGYGEDLDRYPERAEHFGITTLEAMVAKTVPLVFNGGGQKEIVIDGEDGYLWNTENELIEKTHKLISHPNLLDSLSVKAQQRAYGFSCEKFYEKLEKITAG